MCYLAKAGYLLLFLLTIALLLLMPERIERLFKSLDSDSLNDAHHA